MNFTRVERRREEAKARNRIDPSCPREIIREIDVRLASSVAGKKVYLGETIQDLVERECPGIFAIAERAGFILSFALPENTAAALARGVIDYSIQRLRPN